MSYTAANRPDISAYLARVNRLNTANSRAKFGKVWIGDFATILRALGTSHNLTSNKQPFLNLIRDAINRKRMLNADAGMSVATIGSQQSRGIRTHMQQGFAFANAYVRLNYPKQVTWTKIHQALVSDHAGPNQGLYASKFAFVGEVLDPRTKARLQVE